jgi:hypothetical protein
VLTGAQLYLWQKLPDGFSRSTVPVELQKSTDSHHFSSTRTN